MVGDKIRFRFRKSGDLRLLSHLDLTRCFERMLRRAELPFKSSLGFHPAPRMIFALSLPLGVIGDEEVLELELLAPEESETVRERLNRQTPGGLDFHRAAVVPIKTTAMPRRVEYSLAVPGHRVAETEIRIRDMLASPKVWVDRLRPRPRRLNIRPYLRNVTLETANRTSPPSPLSEAERGERIGRSAGVQPSGCSPSGESSRPDAGSGKSSGLEDSTRPDPRAGNNLKVELQRGPGGEVVRDSLLTLDLWVTPSGTARADELLKTLGLSDLVDEGRIVSRSLLEIHDETPPGQPDAPPDFPPESAPLNHTPASVGPENEPAVATWGLSPNGPVVE